MWGGRPRPPTLFADVLTTRDPTLVKRHDECSTSICHSESAPVHLVIPNPLQRCQYTRPCTLSFRIRFSGEESAFPASRFQETRRAPCLATLSTWDSRSDRNGFVSGYAFRRTATDAPCRPAPIGRNCHRTLLRSASHQTLSAHGEGAFKSYSKFRGPKFWRHAHARISQPPRNKRFLMYYRESS